MNINEYISSGILEQYVSNTASAQERQEVECMSHIYPEIGAELISIQTTLEAYAKAEAKTPPAHLRANIFAAIADLENEKPSQSNVENKNLLPTNGVSSAATNDINSVASENKKTFVKREYFKSAAALLFLMSSGLGYLLYNESKKANSFANDLAVVKTEIENQKNIIANNTTQLAVLQNKEFSVISMAGIPTKSPESNALIYWNKQSAEVFVSVKKLPKAATGKQYQLWAIADGKPVDLGMISNEADMNVVFQKMKTIKNPQAFAVTLEVEGGVASPTMAEMYVMGGI